MRKFSIVSLAVILIGSVLAMWSPYRMATAPLQIGAFVLAAAWAVRLALPGAQAKWNPVLVPMCAPLLFALGQLALNGTIYPRDTWNSAIYWGANLALFFVGLQTLVDGALRRAFLNVLVVFGYFISVISPLQQLTAGGKVFWAFEVEDGNSVLGPFVYHNQFAAFMEMLLPLALWNGMVRPDKRVFYLVAAATMYASVIMSASKMGFALSTLEVLLVPILVARRQRLDPVRLVAAAAVFASLAVVLVWAAGAEKLWDRFQVDDIYNERREFTQSSLQMIRSRPLAGFGMGTWPVAYPRFAVIDNGKFINQAHNDWAQWAVEGGLPFAAFMVWIAVWSLRRGFRTIWGLGGAIIFLHCFVDYPIQRAANAGIFFVLLSACAQPDEPSECPDLAME